MRFVLNTYLVRKVIDSCAFQQGAKRYRNQQPIRYAWLQKKKIPIKRLSRDSQRAYCHDYWDKSELTNLWFVDFYVDISKELLKEWNSLHKNRFVFTEDAKNWDKIHRVKTRSGTKGLSGWIKTNLQDEYCNFSGRMYWGFKDEQDAMLFGLTWR